jgi:hypothetical protein
VRTTEQGVKERALENKEEQKKLNDRKSREKNMTEGYKQRNGRQ